VTAGQVSGPRLSWKTPGHACELRHDRVKYAPKPIAGITLQATSS